MLGGVGVVKGNHTQQQHPHPCKLVIYDGAGAAVLMLRGACEGSTNAKKAPSTPAPLRGVESGGGAVLAGVGVALFGVIYSLAILGAPLPGWALMWSDVEFIHE